MDAAKEKVGHQASQAPNSSGASSPEAHGQGEGDAAAASQNASGREKEAYLGYAEQLANLFVEMGRLRASDRLNNNMRGLPAVMRVLAMADGPISPSEIASRTGVSDARVANALRTLEERGFVERRQSEGDRRRVEVVLTAEGFAQDERMRSEGLEHMAEFLAELGEEDCRDLIRLVGRIENLMALRKEQGRQVKAPEDPWRQSAHKGE